MAKGRGERERESEGEMRERERGREREREGEGGRGRGRGRERCPARASRRHCQSVPHLNRILLVRKMNEDILGKKIQDKYPQMTDDVLDNYFGKDEWITGLKLVPA